jgi:ketosteroid isomerase-like protein
LRDWERDTTGQSVDFRSQRIAFGGTCIANGGFENQRAWATLARRDAGRIAFGRLFLANPDWPERLARKAPLNAADHSTFYGEDEEALPSIRSWSRLQDREQIAAVIEQYRRGFATMDVEALKAIWDQDYDHIIYLPQEAAQPVRGWAGVEQYYENIDGLFERVGTMTVSDLSLDVFGDVAYAFCIFHFEGKFKEQSEPFIADGRDTFILRRKSGTWKVIHYHESRPGPRAMT